LPRGDKLSKQKAKGILGQWKEIMARSTDNELRNVYEAVDEVEMICDKIILECEAYQIIHDLNQDQNTSHSPAALPRLQKM